MKRERCVVCGKTVDKLSSLQAILIGFCLLIQCIMLYPNFQPSRELIDAGAGKHIFVVGGAITVGGFAIAYYSHQAPSMAGKLMLTIAGVLWMLSGLGILVHLASLTGGAA